MATTYPGTVKNGVVVFDGGSPLADGTPVNMAPVLRSAHPVTVLANPGSRDAVAGFVGAWDGPPGELDQLLHDVQRMRDEDVELQRRRGPGEEAGTREEEAGEVT